MAAVLLLLFFCCSFCSTDLVLLIELMALQDVSSTEAALVYSLEPVSGALMVSSTPSCLLWQLSKGGTVPNGSRIKFLSVGLQCGSVVHIQAISCKLSQPEY